MERIHNRVIVGLNELVNKFYTYKISSSKQCGMLDFAYNIGVYFENKEKDVHISLDVYLEPGDNSINLRIFKGSNGDNITDFTYRGESLDNLNSIYNDKFNSCNKALEGSIEVIDEIMYRITNVKIDRKY